MLYLSRCSLCIHSPADFVDDFTDEEVREITDLDLTCNCFVTGQLIVTLNSKVMLCVAKCDYSSNSMHLFVCCGFVAQQVV